MQKNEMLAIDADTTKSTLDVITLWLGKIIAVFVAIATLYKGIQLTYRKCYQAYRVMERWIDSVNGADVKIDRIAQIVELNSMRWHALQSRMPVCIYECDAEGNCTFANPALCELYNLSEAEMMGSGWLSRIGRTSAERTLIWREWQATINDHTPYDTIFEVQYEPDVFIKCRSTATAHRNAAGQILMFSGIIEPVKE